MPIINAVYTLSDTTPTLVVEKDNQIQEVHLHNMTKSSNQYIHFGNENVSTSNSIHLDPGESLMLTLRPSDDLYAVSDPDGLELGVMVIRKRD